MQRRFAGLIGAAAAAVTLAAGLPGVANAAVTWTIQPVPLPPSTRGGELSGVACPASTFCLATDVTGASNGTPVIEAWNGSAWAVQLLPLPSGINTGSVTAVSCVSASSCVATGSYPNVDLQNMLAEVWNGSTWTPMTLPEPPGSYNDGVLEAVSCVSATNCTAVGSYGTPASSALGLPLAEHWNGSTWKVQYPPAPAGSGDSTLYGVSCPTATSCTAVGSWQTGQGYAAFIERGSGSSWTVGTGSLPAGATGGGLSAVSCTSSSACIAAGAYTGGSAGTGGRPLAMRYSHGSWTASQPPIPATRSGGLTGISCVLTPAGVSDCTAVGVATLNANNALAEYWNGRQWAQQPTAAPASGKTLAGVSCAADGTCTAVGSQLVKTSNYYQMLAEQN
jgi:hypothetical protein